MNTNNKPREAKEEMQRKAEPRVMLLRFKSRK